MKLFARFALIFFTTASFARAVDVGDVKVDDTNTNKVFETNGNDLNSHTDTKSKSDKKSKKHAHQAKKNKISAPDEPSATPAH